MAIDIIARGLATSILGADGKIEASKMPTLNGTEDLSGFTSIGKLTDPTLVEGKTAEEILLMMLYGVVSPTLTDPSFNILMSADNEQLIIGRPSVLKGSLSFSRGSIDPAYGTSGFRTGAPISYTINGETVESSATSYDFELEVTPTADTIVLNCSVAFGVGDQPLNSVGQPYDQPYAAGALSSTLELIAVHPLYSATGAEHPFEWFEEEDGSGYLSAFSSEADGVRQSFAVSSNTRVIGVKSYNALTQQWEWLGSQTAAISLTYFDTSIISGDTLGEETNYILYTYNATPVGARELKIYVE